MTRQRATREGDAKGRLGRRPFAYGILRGVAGIP
jgi:hypothetical protein